MKTNVDKDLCIGCGLCESLSPKVYKMNDDGVAEPVSDELSEDLLEQAKEARDQCPTEAISVDE